MRLLSDILLLRIFSGMETIFFSDIDAVVTAAFHLLVNTYFLNFCLLY